jgi:hypothetical protein
LEGSVATVDPKLLTIGSNSLYQLTERDINRDMHKTI